MTDGRVAGVVGGALLGLLLAANGIAPAPKLALAAGPALLLQVPLHILLIPAGLGVQELGLVGLGHLVGLDPNAAIALSAVKRMREATIGIPALVIMPWRHG
jgi:hypothetical protein